MISTAGIDARHPLQIPPRGWTAILKRVWLMIGRHNISLMAAGVAFYAFLAFVPLLGAIFMTYGIIADPAMVMQHMRTIIDLVPADAATLISEQLMAVASTAADKVGLGLAIALAVSMYGSMRASGAIISALNVIYEQRETRNIIKTTLISAMITAGAVLVAVMGIFAATLLGYLQEFVAHWASWMVTLVKLVSWMIAGLLASLALAFAYRNGPDRHKARWQWLSLGSISATLLWLLATVGFGIYAAEFANYNATYGSLGAVVVLLMWLFVSAFAILLGAEINAETERQTGIDSTIGPDRPRGQRGATMADTLPPDFAKKLSDDEDI